VLVDVEGGDDQDLHRRLDAGTGEPPGRLDAVQDGQPDVHHGHVGVLFRILEERTGTVIALVVSSLFATHLVNVNATLWGALAIALTGGAMPAAACTATRSLWFPIGLHFAWNFTHAGVFGIAVSGSNDVPDGLLHTTLSGAPVVTGGTVGPEAGLMALLVCLVAKVLLLRRAARTGQIRPRPRT
jgi:hypothetical protein